MSDITYKDGFTAGEGLREIEITPVEGVVAPAQVMVMAWGTQAQADDKDGKPRPDVGLHESETHDVARRRNDDRCQQHHGQSKPVEGFGHA